jgi:MFS family permease
MQICSTIQSREEEQWRYSSGYASLSLFSILTHISQGTCVGPLIAPIISGFITPALGWRWTFWIGLIVAGVSLASLFFLPETFSPILLARRASALRKSTGNTQIFAPIELEEKGFKQMATVTLTRPLRMILFELIVLATCIYLSIAYGIFYMYFEAYPIIFQGIYRQSPGVSGLMFLPIAVGASLATAVFLYYDSYLRKAQALNKPWTQKEESRRLPLACFGGPCYVIALFWLGWTARESVPFYVPMLAGIPFGMGFILIFMALLNYLTDAYEIFAASAMAASSCCRSLAGAVLPFAAAPLYGNLGVAWASSLLGFLSLGMCCVPFIFLWKGDVIRERSTFCRFLKEKKEKEVEELRMQRVGRGFEGVQGFEEKV